MHPELFAARLRQVIQWTERLAAGFDFARGDYGRVFRQTNPSIDGQPLYQQEPAREWYSGTYTTWNVDHFQLAPYQQALEAALARRDVERMQLPNLPVPPELAALGRILLFETQCSTRDETPLWNSSGFVDGCDVPPIDTWFYLEEQLPEFHFPVLYCWIPKAFEPMMQVAIDVEMLASYHWLDEADPALYQRVQALL